MKMLEVSIKKYIIIIDLGFRLPFIEYIINYLKINVIIFGYRGYWKSEGSPSEKGLYLDSEAVCEFVFNN